MSTLYHDPIPNAPGIYRITCIPTGKFYIGSAKSLSVRRNQHMHDLRQNKHHSITLQRAFNKYGEDAFIFDILELVLLPEMLITREQHWLDKLQPFNPRKGYNISPHAQSRLGTKASPETRQKISQSQVGKTISPEQRQKISQSLKGRKFSLETLKKRSEARQGFKHTPETKEKLRQANLGRDKGKVISPEQREKLRQANLGKPMPPKTKVVLSACNEARMITLILTSPDGIEHVVTGIRPFCKEHNLHAGHLIDVAKGKQSQHKGWKARYPD